MAILFDITFTPGATAIGAFLEYRPLHPSGPSGIAQYAWVTNVNTPNSNVIGYFQITSNPMVLNDVPGIFPDFQENSSYEFRVRQLCADGTELYSPVDGTYMVPNCDRFVTDIAIVPIQQGPFGISVSLFYRPFSSISSYTVYLRNFNIVIATHTVSYTQMDTTGNNPYTYVFTNDDLTPSTVFTAIGSYSVAVEITVETSAGPIVVTNCNSVSLKAPGCMSYDVNVGDQWGMQWYDCTGGYHDCYSQQPYLDDGLQVPIQLCALGTPNLYYCDGQNGFVNGSIVDPITGNVQQGGEATLIDPFGCAPGYSDYQLGLLYRDNTPVTCIPNPTCGPSNIIIVNQCMSSIDFDGTRFRNGDPIPEVTDTAQWFNMTEPAWCWSYNEVDTVFGKLYNWYAITDPRNIAPVGYHVPLRDEWADWIFELTYYQGQTPSDLRSVNSLYWDNNAGATDMYNFGAKGAGYRSNVLNFTKRKLTIRYWLNDGNNSVTNFFISTEGGAYGYNPSNINDTAKKRDGYSLRLFCD